MTTITNAVTDVKAIGNREDLSNIIYDISPLETPFVSGISKNRATGVFHEWQTDSLDPAAANTHLEGDATTADTFAATVRVGNICQISKKAVAVSGTQRSLDSAGRADEFSYQLAKFWPLAA